MELRKAIKTILQKNGVEIINEQRFVNFLSDYGAFEDRPALRMILRTFIHERHGLMMMKISKYDQPAQLTTMLKIQSEMETRFGFIPTLTAFLLNDLAYGLGWKTRIAETYTTATPTSTPTPTNSPIPKTGQTPPPFPTPPTPSTQQQNTYTKKHTQNQPQPTTQQQNKQNKPQKKRQKNWWELPASHRQRQPTPTPSTPPTPPNNSNPGKQHRNDKIAITVFWCGICTIFVFTAIGLYYKNKNNNDGNQSGNGYNSTSQSLNSHRNEDEIVMEPADSTAVDTDFTDVEKIINGDTTENDTAETASEPPPTATPTPKDNRKSGIISKDKYGSDTKAYAEGRKEGYNDGWYDMHHPPVYDKGFDDSSAYTGKEAEYYKNGYNYGYHEAMEDVEETWYDDEDEDEEDEDDEDDEIEDY